MQEGGRKTASCHRSMGQNEGGGRRIPSEPDAFLPDFEVGGPCWPSNVHNTVHGEYRLWGEEEARWDSLRAAWMGCCHIYFDAGASVPIAILPQAPAECMSI